MFDSVYTCKSLIFMLRNPSICWVIDWLDLIIQKSSHHADSWKSNQEDKLYNNQILFIISTCRLGKSCHLSSCQITTCKRVNCHVKTKTTDASPSHHKSWLGHSQPQPCTCYWSHLMNPQGRKKSNRLWDYIVGVRVLSFQLDSYQ